MVFLLSIILGFILYYWGLASGDRWSLPIFIATLWPLFTVPYVIFSTINGLMSQKGALSQRSQEFFFEDGRIRFYVGALFALPILQGFLLMVSERSGWAPLFYVSLPVFGLTCDLCWGLMTESTRISSPYKIIALLGKKGKKAIQKDDVGGLTASLSDIMEITSVAQKREVDSLFLAALTEIRELSTFFFQSSKSFAHLDEELKNLEEKKEDRISYILFFLLNNLEEFCEKIRSQRLKNRLTSLYTTIARIAISSGTLDLSLAVFPIDLLGKEALLAEKEGLKEAAIKGQLTLFAIAKELSSLPDLRYQQLKTPFLPLIGYMRAISEAIFKRDKTTSIQSLSEPFRQMKALLEGSALRDHPDIPILLLEVEKTLVAFQALQGIMSGPPPLAAGSMAPDVEPSNPALS